MGFPTKGGFWLKVLPFLAGILTGFPFSPSNSIPRREGRGKIKLGVFPFFPPGRLFSLFFTKGTGFPCESLVEGLFGTGVSNQGGRTGHFFPKASLFFPSGNFLTYGARGPFPMVVDVPVWCKVRNHSWIPSGKFFSPQGHHSVGPFYKGLVKGGQTRLIPLDQGHY